MTEATTVRVERIDDVPLLIGQQVRMGIPRVVNEVLQPHGNWQGLSPGWLMVVWLSYIVSEADHRMNQVEGWAAQRMELLRALVPEPVQVRDFADDRLAALLRYLAEDGVWEEIERRLGRHLTRVYELDTGQVRVDATAAAVYHDNDESVLFRYGHSKDHRPDLRQVKVMLGSLDPLGMPVSTLVAAGNEADDGLYQPVIGECREVIGTGGKLYIGDAKMSALERRAFIHAGGDYYLTPAVRDQTLQQWLEQQLERVVRKEQKLWLILAPIQAGGEAEMIGLGFEQEGRQQADLEGQDLTWPERRLVIFSPGLAQRGRRGLEERLQRAQQALEALTPEPGRGRQQFEELEPLQEAAEAIVARYRVQGLVQVSYERQESQRTIRRYRDRPERVETTVRYQIQVQPDPAAIEKAVRPLGWRVYLTDAPPAQLSLTAAMVAYRGAPLIDRCFLRLKGRPLGLRPLWVQRDDHAQGLVRLLSLAVRILTLAEYLVRRALQQAGEQLAGLYAGNPRRSTARPTSERLLQAFDELSLTIVHGPQTVLRHVTPLSALQQRILELLGLPADLYHNLATEIDPVPT